MSTFEKIEFTWTKGQNRDLCGKVCPLGPNRQRSLTLSGRCVSKQSLAHFSEEEGVTLGFFLFSVCDNQHPSSFSSTVSGVSLWPSGVGSSGVDLGGLWSPPAAPRPGAGAGTPSQSRLSSREGGSEESLLACRPSPASRDTIGVCSVRGWVTLPLGDQSSNVTDSGHPRSSTKRRHST